jgi:hypothetical protein
MASLTAPRSGTTGVEPFAGDIDFKAGQQWGSFEQLRVAGSAALIDGVPRGHVGYVQVKDTRFAILRASEFDRLLAAARDVRRLANGIPVLRSALQLVMRAHPQPDADTLEIQHLYEVVVAFPEFQTGTTPQFADIVVVGQDEDEPAELIEAESFTPPRARTSRETDDR